MQSYTFTVSTHNVYITNIDCGRKKSMARLYIVDVIADVQIVSMYVIAILLAQTAYAQTAIWVFI